MGFLFALKEALGRGYKVLYFSPGWWPAEKEGNLEMWHPLSNPIFGITRKVLRGEFFPGKSFGSTEKLTPMRGLLH